MYNSLIHKQKAIKFKNNEVFITVASIDEDANEIHWMVPKEICESFKIFINSQAIVIPHNTLLKKKIADWYINYLKINATDLDVVSSIEFISTSINEKVNGVYYNQFDMLPCCEESIMKDIFNNKIIKSCVFIEKEKIVSIAHDNGNGVISIETNPSYRNKGLATECLKRLINAYNEINKILYFPTTMDNIAAIKVAEHCGMKKKETGYWIRIKPSAGLHLIKNNNELFED